jgi:DNA-binding NtrC family response regulator
VSRILLLEDDRATRYVLETALRRDGHEVWSLASLEPAIPAAVRHKPDVLIADWLFPEGVAGGTVVQLKALFPNMPIILMSGLPRYAFENDALTVQPIGILEKPFSLGTIRELVKEADRTRRDRMD